MQIIILIWKKRLEIRNSNYHLDMEKKKLGRKFAHYHFDMKIASKTGAIWQEKLQIIVLTWKKNLKEKIANYHLDMKKSSKTGAICPMLSCRFEK